MTKRSYVSSGERRGLLLQSACRVISRDGLPGLTMVAVAKEAGVSRQLVYDHFPDLPALFRFAFAEQARRYEQGLDEVFALGFDDAPTMVRRLFACVLALGPETVRVVRALIEGAIPAELAGLRAHFRSRVCERWAAWFETLHLDDEQSHALVWAMTAAYLSLAESVGGGEIGEHDAASILAMLAEGVVSQAHLVARTS